MDIDRVIPFILALMFMLTALFVIAQKVLVPPVAPRISHKEVRHGEAIEDPYFWLREKTNPAVVKYLEAENAYTEAMTKDLKPFQEALYGEMLSRIKQTDLSVPARRGKYFYYSRTEEGKQYPIHCRKAAAPDGSYDEKSSEFVMLDLNEMAEGLPFLSIGIRVVSDDDNFLAFSTDTMGFRQYTLQVKDLRTSEILEDKVERVTSAEWTDDSRILFYTTEDKQTKRSDRLWRLVLGGEAQLLYEEKDELFYIQLGRTKDKKYLILQIRSTDTWETRFLDSAQSEGEFKIVIPRQKGHKYEVGHRNGLFYIRTNEDAKNFRVVTAPASDPGLANWREFVAHKLDAVLESVELFEDFAGIKELSNGLNRFHIFNFITANWNEINFPEAVYFAAGAETPEFEIRKYRINYQSMVTPPGIYDYDMQTQERTLLKQEELLDGYNPALYTTERLWVTARDGVKIPISIVYKKSFERDGNAPLLLFGYGAYGFGVPTTFDSNRVSLLNRGVACAIAHVRGGNEMGESWHDSGMLMDKKNTFTDFIDCAEFLISEKWTSKRRLVIEGPSAGGLLVGAVTNMRPELFKAVHAAVPWVDVMSDMMDDTLPLTIGEYLEWGNPNEETAYKYMKSYSPYENVEHKSYPAMLVTTNFNDSQVMYWGPARYVAKLRALKTDKNELLLKIKMKPAGHGGTSGRYDQLKDIAFEYSWILKQAGISR